MNRVQRCSKELHEAMSASGLIKPTSSCMVDSVVGFSYVDIKTKGCEGWLNLFWGDHCVALVDNAVIADQMRKVMSHKPNASVSISGDKPEYAPRTCSALTVEQPTQITEDGHLFFSRGYTGSGAEYGARLTRDEYEADLVKQAGPGKLIETDGVFIFEPNDKAQF